MLVTRGRLDGCHTVRSPGPCLDPRGFLGHQLVLSTIMIVILNGKTGKTTEESDPLEMKVGVILPTTVDILAEGKGRKHGLSNRKEVIGISCAWESAAETRPVTATQGIFPTC